MEQYSSVMQHQCWHETDFYLVSGQMGIKKKCHSKDDKTPPVFPILGPNKCKIEYHL